MSTYAFVRLEIPRVRIHSEVANMSILSVGVRLFISCGRSLTTSLSDVCDFQSACLVRLEEEKRELK